MSYWVYIHTCPNGKKYVGCTAKRKPEHRWGRNGKSYRYNKHFYSAILKYGWDNITHEVFEVESEEEMYRKEIELISFYHSNDPKFGYNNSTGGEKSSLGCKHSEEYRKRMSEARKGKLHSEETRKKMSESHKGKPRKPHSEEARKHMSEAQRKVQNKVHSDLGYRKKLSESHKGKPRSEEARKHIAESLKGKSKPKIKISLPDGTVLEISKQNLTRHYINKGKEFQYVS